jgi:uncharacterized membrane protein YhaH (DUF805 family)
MGTFTNSVGHCVRNLANFSGRDRPRAFWPYMGLVIGLNAVVSIFAAVPLIFDMVERIQRFVEEHPDEAVVQSSPGHYEVRIEGFHPELMPDFGLLLMPMATALAVTVVLAAAAVARRLHDRDRTGWWGLLPLPFTAFGLALMPRIFEGSMAAAGSNRVPDPGPMMMLMANNLLHLGAFAFLLVQLVSSGTAGPNRYGPDPLQEGQ